MKYIIMCGGRYDRWAAPRQLTLIRGEPVVARTIRLLSEAGVTDIAISSNDKRFEQFGIPVLHHKNDFHGQVAHGGDWVDGFYPMTTPVCYLFGDVVFSPEAIRTIVETQTDGIQFFASAPPFAKNYPKAYAEPFAFKVSDTVRFFRAIEQVKQLQREGRFIRTAIAWELWQVIQVTPLNWILYDNYIAINDYTCDIDSPQDAVEIERRMP